MPDGATDGAAPETPWRRAGLRARTVAALGNGGAIRQPAWSDS